MACPAIVNRRQRQTSPGSRVPPSVQSIVAGEGFRSVVCGNSCVKAGNWSAACRDSAFCTVKQNGESLIALAARVSCARLQRANWVTFKQEFPHKRGEQLTLRLFCGWWIVAAEVLLQLTFLSICQSTVGVFLRPVVEDMGWHIWQFALGSSMAVMAGALSGVVVGRMVDQRGPRLPVLGGALVSDFCLFGLGRQSSLWLFRALHLCAGFIGWTLFGPLVVNTTINKWFVRRRGWAHPRFWGHPTRNAGVLPAVECAKESCLPIRAVCCSGFQRKTTYMSCCVL